MSNKSRIKRAQREARQKEPWQYLAKYRQQQGLSAVGSPCPTCRQIMYQINGTVRCALNCGTDPRAGVIVASPSHAVTPQQAAAAANAEMRQRYPQFNATALAQRQKRYSNIQAELFDADCQITHDEFVAAFEESRAAQRTTFSLVELEAELITATAAVVKPDRAQQLGWLRSRK